ncbi:MAG TPA: PIN domain-containing protein [Gemmatimonadaceae bacterium]|nr:PIN domain-containing protein [Gemmatimonadaceae bacterium]
MSETSIRSIDTNILLRHLLQDHDDHSPRASALLLDVRKGQRKIFCPATVIFEAIYILHDRVGLSRNEVAWALTNLIELPSFVMRDERVVVDALDFWTKQSPLDYADCYHLTLTKALGMTEIYTFDRKMDRFPGVARVEP